VTFILRVLLAGLAVLRPGARERQPVLFSTSIWAVAAPHAMRPSSCGASPLAILRAAKRA
jgi:hypothetical protein